MTHRIFFAWLLLALMLAGGLDAAPPAPGVALPCKVISVTDGDTIRVEVRVVMAIRFNTPCWAPECRTTNLAEKKLGLLSKAHLVGLANGKRGTLYVSFTGDELSDAISLGRVLGDVWIDGKEKSLGQIQIESGHASTTKGGKLGQ